MSAVNAGDISILLLLETEEFKQQFNAMKADAEAKFGEMSRIAGAAFTAMGAVMVGALGGAAMKATEFGGAMAEINSLGVKNLGALEEAVKAVSTEYGLGLTDAAKAAYQALSAGATEAQTPLLLAEAAKAATAGMSDLTTSIELGSAVSNAFGLALDDVNVVFDQAFIAVKKGVTTFEELSASVGQIAPTMSAAGLSTDEMFASLGSLTMAGIGTSEAATSMKAVLSNIIKPTEGAAKMAEKLGIDFSVAGLKTKGLAAFMEELQSKTGGNVETMGTLFGSTEALGAVLALTGKQSEAFNGMLAEMKTGAGATQEAFDKIVESDPGFAFRQLKAELEVLAVEIGKGILPALKRIVDFVKPIVAAVSDWIQANPTLTATLATVAGAIGAVMLVVGPLLMMLPGLIAAWGLVSTAFLATIAPIALVVAAVALLAAGAFLLVKNWDSVTGFFSSMWDELVGIFTSAIEIVGNVIGRGMAFVYKLFTDPVGAITDIWNGLVDSFWDILGGIADAFDWAWGYIEPIFNKLSGAWDAVSGAFGQGVGDGMAAGGMTGLATGGTVAQGGWALVGERGPELVQLPTGSTVYDAQQTAGAMGGGGSNVTVNMTFSGDMKLDSPQSIRELSRQLADDVQTQLRGMGMGWA